MRWLIAGVLVATTAGADPSTDGEKIKRTIRASKDVFARCYKPDAPIVTTGYRFEFAIDRSGRVTRTHFATGDRSRDECLAKVVPTIRFPPLSSDVTVSYPLR